ncbi:hypothetical protein NDA13_000782 [Ustilago tritici]|nr:hypothetical protein NDA13_000782 [Ustilago tritici]
MTSITSASSIPVLTQSFSSVSSSTIASSSRLPETPIKKETSETSLSDPNSSSKKRRISESNDDQEDDDDEEDLGDSSFASASPSKPSNTGGRRKASDEERKARLEARQARNRLSAQYSRERKKAYVEQLEGSVNTLKAENTLLRSQRDQDQLIRQTLEAKLKDSQLRIDTLETIIRTVAPSLVPFLMSSSSSSSSSSSTVSSSAFAAPSTSAIASQLDAGLSADLAYSLLQNTGLTNKERCRARAVPAADAFTQFDGSAGTDVSAQAKVGSNVDVNGSSIVNQGYPLASQISVLAPEQPSTIADGPRVTLSQHPIEAKAAGVAREAEALLSNFIDLDAKFANSDAAAAAKDQGASPSSASSQPVSVGQGNAAAATAGASRSASASAGELASLGSGRGESGFSGSNSNVDMHSKFNTISLPNDMDGKDVDLQQRFQLLNSPLLPSERNVWELATDAMLQDIYAKTSEDTSADYSAPSVSASDASTHTDASAGSSPFDLVDLDIEIEEPLHLNIGLDENETMDASNGYLHTTSHVGKADASPMDWPGLLASLVA